MMKTPFPANPAFCPNAGIPSSLGSKNAWALAKETSLAVTLLEESALDLRGEVRKQFLGTAYIHMFLAQKYIY